MGTVSGTEEIGQVGAIAANGEAEIGRQLAEAMQKVSNEGVITVEENKGFVTETEVVDGMQFNRGYLSPYFITNADKMIAELEDAVILIHEKKLSSLQPMVPLLELVSGAAEPAATVIASLVRLAEQLEEPASAAGRDALGQLITRVALGEAELRAEVSFAQVDGAGAGGLADLAALAQPAFSVAAPLRLRRRGPELRLVLGGAAAPAPTPDPLLVRTLVEARRRVAAYLDPAARCSSPSWPRIWSRLFSTAPSPSG
jgi:hypothetical protein